MKQTSNLLSIIALVAVGILYILFFTQNRGPRNVAKTDNSTEETLTNIAYFNIDTINSQVEYIKSNDAAMKSKQTRMEEELNREGKKLQNRMESFQRKIQEGKYSQVAAENEQSSILKAQENLEKKNANFLQQVMKEKEDLTKKLNDAMKESVSEVNDESGYDYIFSYQEGGAIFEPNEALDITPEMVSKLNSKLK